jgi:hypothetical protein
MNDLIHWPAEPFTILQAIEANSYLGKSLVRGVISAQIDKGILHVMTPIHGHIKLRHQFEYEMRQNKRTKKTLRIRL